MRLETRPTPTAGSVIRMENWAGYCSSLLETCECPEFAPFRLPSLNYVGVKLACRVRVTGRTGLKLAYDDRAWVRVEVTFVGDGEADTITYGWMAV